MKNSIHTIYIHKKNKPINITLKSGPGNHTNHCQSRLLYCSHHPLPHHPLHPLSLAPITISFHGPVLLFPEKAAGKRILELIHGNRFGKMSVHSGQPGPFGVLGKGVGCHGNDGQFLDAVHMAAADCLGRVIAVHYRHLYVHENHIIV